MTENNAAQAVQESERNAAVEEYFGHRTWIKPTASNFRLFEAGFDRAYALLSKLRAEGDERAAFEADYAKAWNAAYENKTSHTAEEVAELREGDGYGEENVYLNARWRGWKARTNLASAPVAGEARAIVYPPDGTESPFTVINLGSGAVQMGPCLHDGRIGGLWFGKDGKGMGHEQVLGRHAHPGETIAVVTFANVEGLDVMLGELLRCREQYFPDAKAAPQASEAVPIHKLAVAALNDLLIDIRAELGLGTTEEGRAILDTIRALKTQADKDGGDCAKGAGDVKAWIDLFWSVAKELNCLPSSFVDGNEHVLRAARKARAALSPTQPTEQGERDE